MRGISPTLSRAGVLRNYRLVFRTESGFAGAEKCGDDGGAGLHGVLHRITQKESDILDSIEVLYTKDKVEVIPYDQAGEKEPIQAIVYVFDEEQIARNPKK